MSNRIIMVDGEVFQLANQTNPVMWQGYRFGYPFDYSSYFEDFFYYVAADWTVTNTGGNTQALATVAPCANGVLLITVADADDNVCSMQKVGHSFVPTAGQTIFYETRFRTSEATQQDWLHGLVITDTSPLAHTDGIVFRKDDGDTNVDFATTSGSATSTETGIHTFAANTYVKVGFKVVGTAYVEYWVNDVLQGSLTTNIPTAPLRPTLLIQDGDTTGAVGAQTMSVDYIFVAQSR